ncbi:MAG: glycosyltransferase family 39 protein [Vicinamibacterales bacterium]
MPDRIRRWTLAALLAAAVLPYFIGLGDSSIWDANEAFYVETPREMIERGDYLFPTFNYQPRLNKPVLSYWIVGAFYQVFGISVGVQRLPIALGALVMILTAGGLGWLAASGTSGRAAPRTHALLWSMIGLAIAPRLLMLARRVFIDVYISMFMALTLLWFAAAERHPERRRLFLALMYASVGLGMLTKGPVAAVVPGLVMAAYLLLHRELRRVTDMMIPAGVVIILVIVAPWYGALYARDGWTYIVSFFVGENFDRFASGVGVQVQRGPLFYLPVLFSDSFPWSLFLIPAFVAWLRERRLPPAEGDASGRVRTLLWLWIAVFVGFFSFSAGKQDLYIFPIVPAVCGLAGWAIARACQGLGVPSTSRTAAVIGALLLSAGAGLVYLATVAGASYAIEGVAAIGIAGLVAGALAIWFGLRQRIFAAGVALSTGFVALSAIFVIWTLPSFEAYKPVPGFAATIRQRAAPDDVVATYAQSMPSLVYYLRRHVDDLFDVGALVTHLTSGKPVFAVMSEGDLERLRPDLPGPLCVIDRRPTLDVRLKSVLAANALPQLVLVTNRCTSP